MPAYRPVDVVAHLCALRLRDDRGKPHTAHAERRRTAESLIAGNLEGLGVYCSQRLCVLWQNAVGQNAENTQTHYY